MFISTEHSSNNTVVPVGDTSWLHTWLQLQLHHATLGWLHSTYFQQPQTVLRPTSSSIRLQSRSSPLHVIESRYSLARAETRTSQMSHISGKERERNWRREGCDEQLAATIAVRHCCTRRRAQTLLTCVGWFGRVCWYCSPTMHKARLKMGCERCLCNFKSWGAGEDFLEFRFYFWSHYELRHHSSQ